MNMFMCNRMWERGECRQWTYLVNDFEKHESTVNRFCFSIKQKSHIYLLKMFLKLLANFTNSVDVIFLLASYTGLWTITAFSERHKKFSFIYESKWSRCKWKIRVRCRRCLFYWSICNCSVENLLVNVTIIDDFKEHCIRFQPLHSYVSCI